MNDYSMKTWRVWEGESYLGEYSESNLLKFFQDNLGKGKIFVLKEIEKDEWTESYDMGKITQSEKNRARKEGAQMLYDNLKYKFLKAGMTAQAMKESRYREGQNSVLVWLEREIKRMSFEKVEK